MKLGMGFSQTLRLSQKCLACGEDMSEHKPDCPQLAIEIYVKSLVKWMCSRCHNSKGFVEQNIDDWLECRHCHSLFSSGQATPVDAETLERTKLFKVGYYSFEDVIDVLILPFKGKGEFRSDVQLKMMRAELDRVKKECKAQKRSSSED